VLHPARFSLGNSGDSRAFAITDCCGGSTPINAEPTPSFSEKIETLRNADVELRLTNRGGGIKEGSAQANSRKRAAGCFEFGSEPANRRKSSSTRPRQHSKSFTGSAGSDSVVQFERTTAEQIVIRKKFFFENLQDNKDNYVIEMDVDLEKPRDKVYQSGGYFVALGSAAPIHPKDYPSYTRLVVVHQPAQRKELTSVGSEAVAVFSRGAAPGPALL